MSIPPPLHEARIALLIDADNAPAAKIDVILAELAKIGVANIRRAYGNWKKSELRGWEEVLHDYAIRPIQQFDYSKGKNATDMGMVIDAMDLLYTDRPEAFGIVSSDSDFTPLVLHLKAKGAKVYGFGAKKTPLPFVNACSRFLYLENIGQSGSIEDAPEVMLSTPSSSRSGKRGRGGRPGGPNGMTGAAGGSNGANPQGTNATAAQEPRNAEGAPLRMDRSALKRDARLVTLLRNAVESAAGEDGWSALGAVGQQIGNQASFDPRNYGYRKLIDLIDATQLFDLDRRGTQFVLRDKRQGGSPMAGARSDLPRDGGREAPRDAVREPQPDSPRDFQRDARDAARDVFLDLQREDAQEDDDPVDEAHEDQDDERDDDQDDQHDQGDTTEGGADLPDEPSVAGPLDSQRSAPRDVQRDPPRDDRRNAPRDAQRDAPRRAQTDTPRDAPREGRRDSPRNAPRNAPQAGRRDTPRDARHDQAPRGAQRDSQRDPQRDAQRDPRHDGQRDGQRDTRRDPQRDPQRDAARNERAGGPPQGRPADRHPFELPADSPARQFANAFRDPPFQAWEPEFDEPAVQARPAEEPTPVSAAPTARTGRTTPRDGSQSTRGDDDSSDAATSAAVESSPPLPSSEEATPAAKRRSGRSSKRRAEGAADEAPTSAAPRSDASAPDAAASPPPAPAPVPVTPAMDEEPASSPAASGRNRRPKKTVSKAAGPASQDMADEAAAEPSAPTTVANVESPAPAKKRPARKSTRPAAKKATRREP